MDNPLSLELREELRERLFVPARECRKCGKRFVGNEGLKHRVRCGGDLFPITICKDETTRVLLDSIDSAYIQISELKKSLVRVLQVVDNLRDKKNPREFTTSMVKVLVDARDLIVDKE